MQKAEYDQIFSQFENDIEQLKEVDNLYDYERLFAEFWTNAGRRLFERSLGEVPENHRKKNCRDAIWNGRD